MTDHPSTDATRTCYRHSDRRGGVVCQRCDRPICPSCMTQASVGFHCPECLKVDGQKVYRGTAALAGKAPIVTQVIIAVNLAVYALSSYGNAFTSPGSRFTGDWGLFGYDPRFFGGVGQGEWWRLITGGFLHASPLHIAFNMYLLWMLGQQLEKAFGRVTFAAIYGASLLGGSLGVMILDVDALTVGASGAVFGLFGFALANYRGRGINPLQTSIGGIVVMNLVFTFAIPNISIGGHLGGLVAGYIVGEATNLIARQERPKAVLPIAIAALGLAFAIASIVVASP